MEARWSSQPRILLELAAVKLSSRPSFSAAAVKTAVKEESNTSVKAEDLVKGKLKKKRLKKKRMNIWSLPKIPPAQKNPLTNTITGKYGKRCLKTVKRLRAVSI